MATFECVSFIRPKSCSRITVKREAFIEKTLVIQQIKVLNLIYQCGEQLQFTYQRLKRNLKIYGSLDNASCFFSENGHKKKRILVDDSKRPYSGILTILNFLVHFLCLFNYISLNNFSLLNIFTESNGFYCGFQ